MIIGEYEVGAYGYARGTNDLDIFINATHENAQKMRQACVSTEDLTFLQKLKALLSKKEGIGIEVERGMKRSTDREV